MTGPIAPLPSERLPAAVERCELLINSTSVGMEERGVDPDDSPLQLPGWARAWRWQTPDVSTVIHAFDLAGPDGTPVRYAATGSVDGWPFDPDAV